MKVCSKLHNNPRQLYDITARKKQSSSTHLWQLHQQHALPEAPTKQNETLFQLKITCQTLPAFNYSQPISRRQQNFRFIYILINIREHMNFVNFTSLSITATRIRGQKHWITRALVPFRLMTWIWVKLKMKKFKLTMRIRCLPVTVWCHFNFNAFNFCSSATHAE